ncbi:DUF1289 domain-containing protein [Ancylomarina sp. 16SWW S1-10-2]|uniref:DUF1289 domain-containing protein n=1 Tax=Ancylomarina sp. 16SWW S1-10-2 TaxID=2499681 RepID=UPI0012AE99BC|nr:DUF1289 domain-containing protein [Ancylomarina sp. 16SWW S1-10-2]MRT91872.1 DUF1289 domain-containing protein [Ancylomarina sp. 16SWW S1-10-2]
MEDVKSPCIQICRADSNGVCFGCRRTNEEIGDWSLYTNEQKKEVIEKASKRRNAPDTQSGGFFR